MDPTVILEVRDGVAEIVLNRPQRRNAITQEMRARLEEAVLRVDADDGIRAVLLRGAGGHFCAGGDVEAIRSDNDAASSRARLISSQKTLAALRQLDRPVIAAVEGVAYGAGLGLAAAADLVLATPGTRFCASFMRIGLAPDFGLSYTLPRLVGLQRAKAMIFSAREVGGDEALAIGLAGEVLPADRLLTRAREIAAAFATASPTALSLAKRALDRSLESDLSTMLAIEADAQGIALSTAYAANAMQRFLSKTPPPFTWPATPGS